MVVCGLGYGTKEWGGGGMAGDSGADVRTVVLVGYQEAKRAVRPGRFGVGSVEEQFAILVDSGTGRFDTGWGSTLLEDR